MWTAINAEDNTRTLRAYRLLNNWDESQATWNSAASGNNQGAPGAVDGSDIDSGETGSNSVPAKAGAMDCYRAGMARNIPAKCPKKAAAFRHAAQTRPTRS